MIECTSKGVILTIHAQPKASKTQFVGLHGNALKFKIAAQPVEGEANTALCEFLAELFSIPKRSVEICAGHSHRHKRVKLIGVSERDVRATFKVE